MTDHSTPARGDYERADDVAVALLAVMPINFDLAPFREAMAQSYAVHRLATIEECAKIAALRSAQHEASALPRWTVTNARKHEADAIATAIRNLGRGA